MRKLIAPLFAVLAFSVNAQLWEQACQPSEGVHWDRALPMGGGHWAVIGGPSFAGSHVISVRNADGTVAWEQASPYGTNDYLGAVVLMPDSGLLHAGVIDYCDSFGPESRVCRYAPDGTVLWERIITPLFAYPVTMAAKGSIDHVAVASGDSVYIMDLDGNTVGGFAVVSGDLQRILWASDSTLFTVIGNDISRVDLEGTVLTSTPIGASVSDMYWSGQQLFVLTSGGVQRFSAELAPLGVVALPDLDASSAFIVSEGGLYVNTAGGLYQLADDGTVTLLFPWPALPNLTTTACAVRNGTVLAVGNTDISGRNTGIIRTLSMGGDAVEHDQDVEVLLQVDSAWTEYAGPGFYPWNRRADLTGLVVNHGTDTLRSVVLSMWKYVPFLLCDQFTNRIDTAGLTLAPGDTVSLPFGIVDVALGLTQGQVANATAEICIVALAPDLLADRATDDNTACSTVDYVLGVHELSHNSSLSLAPNPAINSCVVSGLASMGAPVHLAIMDLTGRIVSEHFNTASTNTMQLDISGLSPATYILSAEGVRGRAMTKLVIARP